jgi:hypothetical protein
MNFEGSIIGVAAFLIIIKVSSDCDQDGISYGCKSLANISCCGYNRLAASLFISGFMLSGIVSVFGFACLWSIRELHEQAE